MKRILKKLEKLSSDKQIEKAEAEFWGRADEFESICFDIYKPVEAFFDEWVSLFFYTHKLYIF